MLPLLLGLTKLFENELEIDLTLIRIKCDILFEGSKMKYKSLFFLLIFAIIFQLIVISCERNYLKLEIYKTEDVTFFDDSLLLPPLESNRKHHSSEFLEQINNDSWSSSDFSPEEPPEVEYMLPPGFRDMAGVFDNLTQDLIIRQDLLFRYEPLNIYRGWNDPETYVYR